MAIVGLSILIGGTSADGRKSPLHFISFFFWKKIQILALPFAIFGEIKDMCFRGFKVRFCRSV